MSTENKCVCSTDSLVDVLEKIRNDALKAINLLSNDKHASVMDQIENYEVDLRVPSDIANQMMYIKSRIPLMRKHDYSRTELMANLDQLIITVDHIKAEMERDAAKHTEAVMALSALFKFLGEHAEEVVSYIEADNTSSSVDFTGLMNVFGIFRL